MFREQLIATGAWPQRGNRGKCEIYWNPRGRYVSCPSNWKPDLDPKKWRSQTWGL